MIDDSSHHCATTRSFEEKYLRFRTAVGTTFRDETGGSTANGWTTVEQVEWLVSVLGLESGDRLLDLGAGRGWPGGLMAQRTGAQLVSIDVPLEALRQGRRGLSEQLERPVLQVCADGRMLPIGDGHFSGVCHADVMC